MHRLAPAGFDDMRLVSRRNDEPERASRPFDADRDGFVLSEWVLGGRMSFPDAGTAGSLAALVRAWLCD